MIYGNYINESFVDDTIQNFTNLKALKQQWKGTASKFVKHKWIYRYIKDDSVMKRLQNWYSMLTDDEVKYQDYLRGFKNIANFFGLPKEQIIIEHMTFEEAKGAEPAKVAIRYSKGLVKVKIPTGVSLIHTSPVSGIKELQPSFRSKTKGMFMYPSKRVFFTVAKDINPRKNGTQKMKLTKYTTKAKFDEVYIDPTYTDFSDGSVMVITNQPIPVEKYENKLLKIFSNKATNESAEEIIEGSLDYSPFIQDLIESMEFDEEYLNEASIKDFLQTLKNWHTANDKHAKQQFISNNISDEEYTELKGYLDQIKSAENINEYRVPFGRFLRFCNILPHNVVVTKYTLKKGKEDHNSLYVEYSHNNKKIKLPEGIKLYHMSKVDNITALKPQFKGKSERGYLYDKPRVYFTINKHMPKFLADYGATEKMYKYECTKKITEVFVDPLVYNIAQGAVYVETNTEIPVRKITIEDTVNSIKNTASNIKNKFI